ncbi:hypothetical protein [Shimia sp. SDUM112013]|uniref:hypothetical protein n=1 Tax=Shimia sp. SDUM112013 TaxID=3136160 RepID=UPI0032EE1394
MSLTTTLLTNNAPSFVAQSSVFDRAAELGAALLGPKSCRDLNSCTKKPTDTVISTVTAPETLTCPAANGLPALLR